MSDKKDGSAWIFVIVAIIAAVVIAWYFWKKSKDGGFNPPPDPITPDPGTGDLQASGRVISSADSSAIKDVTIRVHIPSQGQPVGALYSDVWGRFTFYLPSGTAGSLFHFTLQKVGFVTKYIDVRIDESVNLDDFVMSPTNNLIVLSLVEGTVVNMLYFDQVLQGQVNNGVQFDEVMATLNRLQGEGRLTSAQHDSAVQQYNGFPAPTFTPEVWVRDANNALVGGAVVQIYDSGVLLGEMTTPSSGGWKGVVRFSTPFPCGHELTIKVTVSGITMRTEQTHSEWAGQIITFTVVV